MSIMCALWIDELRDRVHFPAEGTPIARRPAGCSRWCAAIALCLDDCSGISAASGRRDVFPRTCRCRAALAALAQSLGIDPVPDRGRFIYEITRILYNTPEGRRAVGRRLPAARCVRRWPAARDGSRSRHAVRATRCRCR